mgnify:CR=1 FL=1
MKNNQGPKEKFIKKINLNRNHATNNMPYKPNCAFYTRKTLNCTKLLPKSQNYKNK